MIFMSTNFIDIGQLLPFLQLLDDNLNHKLIIKLQISMDAKDIKLQQYGHVVPWEKYYNNLINLFDNLEQNNNLKWIKIIINPHSVLPDNVIYENFSDNDSIFNFMNDFNIF